MKDCYSLLAAALAAASFVPITAQAGTITFPITGSYGQVNGQGNPCDDARRQREGDYVEIRTKKIFLRESSDTIVSFQPKGGGWFDMTMRAPNGTNFKVGLYADRYRVLYQGALFARCM